MGTTIYISLLLFGTALAVPFLYKDRQDGDANVRVQVDDVSILVIPPTKLVEDLVQAFGRQNAQVEPAEGQSKEGDRNSPYTVELSSIAAEEAKAKEEEKVVQIPAKKVEDKQEELVKVQEESKKKVEDKKPQEIKKKVEDKKTQEIKKKVDEPVKKVVEDVPKKVVEKKKGEDVVKRGAEDSKKKMKMDEEKEVLTLIQEGIEECGPDGERNSQGICVYTPVKL